jgi:hypothetical protein
MPSRRIEEALTVPNAFRGQARHSVFDFGIAFVDALLIEIVEGNRLSQGSRGTGSQPDASRALTVG